MNTPAKPDKSIADSGERMVPAYHKGHMVYGEHIVRYQAATEIVRNKVVLDIASGSGYGTAQLAKSAKKVFGVDLDVDAIKYAKKNYFSNNTEFIKGSGTKIPLQEDSVDVVVSFETIEHIEHYNIFMQEIVRVLRPNGLLILSTPNDIEFPEDNHYHVHEFEEKELRSLVKKYFKNTKDYYQATWLYNALVDKDGLGTEWQAQIQTMQTAPISPKKSIYFFMLCSNRALSETVEPIAAISEHYSARSNQEYEKSVRKLIEEQGAIILHQENQVKQLEVRLQNIKNPVKSLAVKAKRFSRRIHKSTKNHQ